MGRYYGLKIKSGRMVIDEVPKLWRTMTEIWLEKNP